MPSDGGARWVVAQEERRRYPADKILLDLPLSIASNREPFRHGEWRKQPFIARCAPLPLPLPAIHLCPRWSRAGLLRAAAGAATPLPLLFLFYG